MLDIIRLTNSTLLISREKKPIGIPLSIAKFFAIVTTKAVLPIAGLAAIIIKLDGCQPAVILSISSNPDSTPVIPVGLDADDSISSKASFRGSLIDV